MARKSMVQTSGKSLFVLWVNKTTMLTFKCFFTLLCHNLGYFGFLSKKKDGIKHNLEKQLFYSYLAKKMERCSGITFIGETPRYTEI